MKEAALQYQGLLCFGASVAFKMIMPQRAYEYEDITAEAPLLLGTA
jgi:hypothetical protein